VAGKDELRASPRERALAGFAALLTEAPWTLAPEDLDRLRSAGVSEEGLEQAISVAAFFNYFPRVADGTGIDFDYASPLPRITIDHGREALPRPSPSTWNPAVDGSSIPVFPRRQHAQGALERWHAYHFERDAPLSRRERHVLARAAAEELCDAGALARWHDALPRDEREHALSAYAKKLTLTPWAMGSADLAPLREHGMSDGAILDAITLIAHQNTFSRMQHGLAALRAVRG
jgi:alkylhydroperoxidase family enzyme